MIHGISSLDALLCIACVAVTRAVAGHSGSRPAPLVRRAGIDTTTTAITSASPDVISTQALKGGLEILWLSKTSANGSLSQSQAALTTAATTLGTGYRNGTGCALTDNSCAFPPITNTIQVPQLMGLGDQCLLWDDYCSGNKTLAIENFFGGTFRRLNNAVNGYCFADTSQPSCKPPERNAELEKIKSWMRSPQCMSSGSAYIQSNSIFMAGNTDPTHPANSCCGTGTLYTDNVEVYYWPVPEANTSCLSVVGDKFYPRDGATMFSVDTTFTQTYWGCTGHLPGDTSLSYIETATMQTFGAIPYKAYEVDPWGGSVACIETTSTSSAANNFTKVGSLRARGHSLVIPASISQENGIPVSTVISGQYTL